MRVALRLIRLVVNLRIKLLRGACGRVRARRACDTFQRVPRACTARDREADGVDRAAFMTLGVGGL